MPAQTEALRALETLVQMYLWPASAEELEQAKATLASNPSWKDVTRRQFHDFEEIMRRGRTNFAPPPALSGVEGPAPIDGRMPLQELSVVVPGGASIPVRVQLPPTYAADREWPLMFAMHGGPPSTPEQALKGTERMLRVWTEAAGRSGWIVAAPALVTVVSHGERTEARLPYEIFHPEQAEAVIRALRARYRINADRIVSTGISLGSNFSIAFAAARPGWLSAIVPVSTEGDSRERVLRNLRGTPIYVLEGALDENIRGISGPRALDAILRSFGYDLVYREFSDRAHEGFQEHYGDVLRWLEGRPRDNYPREVLRVPHSGIMGTERRVWWIEGDTRQGLIRAVVTNRHRIDVTTRWTRKLTLYLHDRLVDLDEPVEIWVNGVRAFAGKVPRSIVTALEQARALDDERRIYAAELTVDVPITGRGLQEGAKLWKALTPRHPEGPLSFWERYAAAALEERFPTLGLEGVETPPPAGSGLAGEQVAIRLTAVAEGSAAQSAGLARNDVLLEVAGEPFFRGQGGLDTMYRLILRELRAEAQDYTFVVWRNGRRHRLTASLKLASFPVKDSASSASAEER